MCRVLWYDFYLMRKWQCDDLYIIGISYNTNKHSWCYDDNMMIFTYMHNRKSHKCSEPNWKIKRFWIGPSGERTPNLSFFSELTHCIQSLRRIHNWAPFTAEDTISNILYPNWPRNHIQINAGISRGGGRMPNGIWKWWRHLLFPYKTPYIFAHAFGPRLKAENLLKLPLFLHFSVIKKAFFGWKSCPSLENLLMTPMLAANLPSSQAAVELPLLSVHVSLKGRKYFSQPLGEYLSSCNG